MSARYRQTLSPFVGATAQQKEPGPSNATIKNHKKHGKETIKVICTMYGQPTASLFVPRAMRYQLRVDWVTMV